MIVNWFVTMSTLTTIYSTASYYECQ